MNLPDPYTYLADTVQLLRQQWPGNRTVNIVCHGHSVPSGYFATPYVDSLNAYPHQLFVALKQRFPYAVINVIITAIGGENSASGAARFADVLGHRPDVITIDYGLNDRGIGLDAARQAWTTMIRQGLEAGIKIILLTPTTDLTQAPGYQGSGPELLSQHAEQIRQLAAEHGVGLADSFASHQSYAAQHHLTDLLSWQNHPNRFGHELVTTELMRWFPAALM